MPMANDKKAMDPMDNVPIASTACQMQGSASIVISTLAFKLDESIVMQSCRSKISFKKITFQSESFLMVEKSSTLFT